MQVTYGFNDRSHVQGEAGFYTAQPQTNKVLSECVYLVVAQEAGLLRVCARLTGSNNWGS